MQFIDIRNTNWKGQVCYLWNDQECVMIRHEEQTTIKRIKDIMKDRGFIVSDKMISYVKPPMHHHTKEQKHIQDYTRKVVLQAEMNFE